MSAFALPVRAGLRRATGTATTHARQCDAATSALASMTLGRSDARLTAEAPVPSSSRTSFSDSRRLRSFSSSAPPSTPAPTASSSAVATDSIDSIAPGPVVDPIEPIASHETVSAAASESVASTLPAEWTPNSRRVGLIAFKRGMTTFFLSDGTCVPATLLQVAANQISAHVGLDPAKDGTPANAYTALQVAAVDAKPHTVTAQIKGHLSKANVGPKKIIKEFKITKDAVVPLGTYLSAHHFVPGQHIDVTATTRGKGFQGPMKRHGFKGLRASHGVSVSHRSHGSTGQHQDPGRVFPGKKMAGRMGGNHVSTVHNLQVLRVDDRTGTILVKGNVPGPDGATVVMRDAIRALVDKAANAYRSGRLLNGSLATGKEGQEEYLPGDIQKLPFPAATREVAQHWPAVVEIGPKQT